MRPRIELEIMGEHAGAMRIGRWRNIVICSWCGQPTGEAMATLSRLMVKLHAGSTEQRSYIHMVPDQLALPDAEARSGISGVMKTYEPYIACVGVIIAGGGFWASAMRSAVSGLRLLLRTPFDYRLHASVDELLEWFPDSHYKRTAVEITPRELRALTEIARSWRV